MDAVDSYIPNSVRPVDKPFLMPIEDVFGIKGRGTVATGRIERGVVKVGEEVEIVGIQATRKVVVTGVEMFKKLLDQGEAGDNVGCLLRGIERDDIERGQVLAKAGSVTPHTKFTAQVYVLTKEEGGRHTPFYNGYRPQFTCAPPSTGPSAAGGAEMIMPGDNVEMSSFDHPDRAEVTEARHPRRADRRCRAIGHRVGDEMAKQRIRIHSRPTTIDCSIVGGPDRGDGPADRRGCRRPRAAAYPDREVHRPPVSVHRQGQPGAVRDPHSQAARRHPGSLVEDRGRPDATQPPGWRRHRNQDVAR
jgi:hypothetical protein